MPWISLDDGACDLTE